jgi:hypothetical protein
MARYVDEMLTRFSVEGASTLSGAMDRQGAAVGRVAKNYDDLKLGAGLAMIAAGQALSNFAGKNVDAAKKMEVSNQELESLFAVKGYSPAALESIHAMSDSMLKQGGISRQVTTDVAAQMTGFDMNAQQITTLLPRMAGQAQLYHKSMEEVGLSIGKAFGSGMWANLRRVGVTLAAPQIEQLKALQLVYDGTGTAAEKMAAREQQVAIINKAIGDNVAPLSDRLKTATGRMEKMQGELEIVQEQMGKGVVETQAYGATLLTGLIEPLGVGHEALLRFAGGVEYVAGPLFKVGGALLAGGQALMTYRLITAISTAANAANTVSTTASTAAQARGIPVAQAEAVALTEEAAAAQAAAVAQGELALVAGGAPGGSVLTKFGTMDKAALARQAMKGNLGALEELGVGGGGALAAGEGAAGAGILGAGGAMAIALPIAAAVGTALAGWEIGSLISGWLDKETHYIDKWSDKLSGAPASAAAGMQSVRSYSDIVAQATDGRAEAAKETKAQRIAESQAQQARIRGTTTAGGNVAFSIPAGQLVTSQAATAGLNTR